MSDPTSDPTDVVRPYRDAALAVYESGVGSPLPVPYGQKSPPPSGWTGAAAPTASRADVETWLEADALSATGGNIAVRLAPGVVGIDVDAYAPKRGGETLAELEADLGPLPPTFTLTSRTDGVSGVRLYRVKWVDQWEQPVTWPGEAGEHVDVIHHGYRYVMWAGSLHPGGGTYRLEDRRSPGSRGPLDAGLLPALPLPWVDYLQGLVPDPRDAAALAQGYAGTPYDDLDELAQHVAYTTAVDAVDKVVAELYGAQAWPDGHRDDQGRGWEKLAADSAQTLRTLLAEGWSGLDPDALRQTFLDAAPVGGDWTRRDNAAKWANQTKPVVAGGRIKPPVLNGYLGPVPARDGGVSASGGSDGALVPDSDFWGQRDSLQAVEGWARARMVSPWATLGAVLARVTASVPPYVVLPAYVGDQASLNLFVAMVSASGGGKGAAMRVAGRMLKPWDVHTHTVGSGEGLVKQYARKGKDPDDPDPHAPQVQLTIRDAVLFDVPEIDTLGGVTNRSGATLMPALRSAWSGEQLGFAYADVTKEILLPAHSYRLCMVVGVQPKRAGGILTGQEADGGTPQRFLWVPGDDPDAPDDLPPVPPTWDLAHPDVQSWRPPAFSSDLVELALPRVAVETIISSRRAVLRGQGSALDGHALLTRAKVTVALALLEGRRLSTEGDWEIAGQIMAKSDETRQAALDVLSREAKRATEATGYAEGIKAAMVDDARHQAAVQRLVKVAGGKLPDDWTAASNLRRMLTSRDRHLWDAVMLGLVAGGHAEAETRANVTYLRRAK